MLEIEIFPENNRARLTFTGDLSVAKTAEMQQQLLKTGLKVKNLEIVTDQVENLDLSFLQLLFSWTKEMKQSGKNLIFEFRMDEEFNRIFNESGFKEAFDQL